MAESAATPETDRPEVSALLLPPGLAQGGDSEEQDSLEKLAAGLSASAPPFVPEEAGDLLARLPQSHRAFLRGCYQAVSGEWISYYVGYLKSFNSRTGFGFLECKQSKNDWGQDVFIHKNFVPTPWNLGQPVEFAVTVNNRGQPQAVDVNWLPKLPTARPAVPGTTIPLTAARPQQALTAGGAQLPVAPAPARTSPVPARRFFGILKSFSPAQGYGFITSEDVHALHQRDTYLDKSQLPAKGGSWKLNQTIEFAIMLNMKGQPQARNVNWDPIPHNSAVEFADSGSSQSSRAYSVATTEKLRKLLRLLGDQQIESAVVTAIDLQGGSVATGGPPSPEGDGDVDYVCYVLDRLGPEPDVARDMKDFVKMLLLLMLAKMLRIQSRQTRCDQILRWFEAISTSISVKHESVKAHFQDVVDQINTNLQNAIRDNKWLQEQALQARLQAAFMKLQEKASQLNGA